jgi:AcrR family transcriptional regulator
MRITAEAKRRTRQTILDVAAQLMADKGLDAMTTREVAERVGIAHGTLFNYFPTKEVLALSLCAERLQAARTELERQSHSPETLGEALFADAAAGLRHLEPFRTSVAPLLQATLGPAADDDATVDGNPLSLKTRQLQGVARLIEAHLGPGAASDMALHLYWSLYLGVLSWWAADASPHREDTLAVLDRSLQLFVASLTGEALAGETR